MRRSNGTLLIWSLESLQQSRAKISKPDSTLSPNLSMNAHSLVWAGEPFSIGVCEAQALSSVKKVYLEYIVRVNSANRKRALQYEHDGTRFLHKLKHSGRYKLDVEQEFRELVVRALHNSPNWWELFLARSCLIGADYNIHGLVNLTIYERNLVAVAALKCSVISIRGIIRVLCATNRE